jgi:hypothetical protein
LIRYLGRILAALLVLVDIVIEEIFAIRETNCLAIITIFFLLLLLFFFFFPSFFLYSFFFSCFLSLFLILIYILIEIGYIVCCFLTLRDKLKAG